MKNTIFLLTLVLIAALAVTTANAQEVNIPDDELAAVIRETLGLPADAAITVDAMRELTGLRANFREIADLTGLEHAVNLTWLALWQTPVSNISPLANLTNLEWLHLEETAVSDISALQNLTKLEGLDLRSTAVSDISVLASLTNLEELYLSGTAVSDISVLANLTNLEELYLDGTAVSDVSPLLGLSLPGNWTGIGLRLKGSPLSYASLYTHIPALQAKGIEVLFDNVADVNGDGVVNIQDLELVAGQLGKTGEHVADVNGDGVVNILDLVWVAGAFGN